MQLARHHCSKLQETRAGDPECLPFAATCSNLVQASGVSADM
jgi:hypothetical protein